MNVDELRRALEVVAGPTPPAEPAHAAILASVKRRTRRHRGVAALVVALAVTAAVVTVAQHSGRDEQKVTTQPPTTAGTTTTGSPSTTRPVPDAARATLEAWSSFPVDADPRPLVLTGLIASLDLVNAPARGFPDGGTKDAYESGQFDVTTSVPAEPASASGYPLITGQKILDRLRASGSSGPPGPAPLTIISIQLGEGEFATDRGQQPLPAWLVTFAGISDPAQVLAIAPEGVYPSPSPVPIEQPTTTTTIRPGAATLTGDRGLSIRFTGKGPEPGPCGGDYEADVYESDQAVAVRVRELPRKITTTTTDGVVGCDLVGHGRTVTSELRAPLGARVVVDAETRIPLPVSR